MRYKESNLTKFKHFDIAVLAYGSPLNILGAYRLYVFSGRFANVDETICSRNIKHFVGVLSDFGSEVEILLFMRL